MATHEQLVNAARTNGNFTLAQIRDSLPADLDLAALLEEARQFDERFFVGRPRAEVVCIALAMLTANLLPD